MGGQKIVFKAVVTHALHNAKHIKAAGSLSPHSVVNAVWHSLRIAAGVVGAELLAPGHRWREIHSPCIFSFFSASEGGVTIRLGTTCRKWVLTQSE